MATKEEHLWEMFGSQEFATKDLRLWLCEALAERDAAQEELAKLKAAQPAESLRNSLAMEVNIDTGMHIDYILRAALDRLHFMEQAAQPAAEAPAPFVIASTGGESVQWAEAPSPEAAAPEHDRRTFTRQGCYIRSNGFDWLRLVDGSSAKNADEALRLLNAGLEAETLRARVAELEEQLGTRDTDRIWRSLHNPYDAIERECAKQKARADAAEAKLAALGENPIRRGLVERWQIPYPSTTSGTGWVLREILYGRGPGGAA